MKSNKPFGIYFETTHSCNLNCKTCLVAARPSSDNEMKIDEFMNFAKKAKDFGAETVFFTGGEPLIKPGFLQCIPDLHSIGYEITIITNGMLITDESIDIFYRNNVHVNLSLDSTNYELNDFIRGKGTAAKLDSLIKFLTEKNIKTTISVTVNKMNFDYLHEFIEKYGGYENLKIHFLEVIKRGRAIENWDKLGLSDEQKNIYPKKIEEILFSVSNEINHDDSCWAGDSIFINPQGDIFLCSELCQLSCMNSIGKIGDDNIFGKIQYCLNNDFSGIGCRYKVWATKNISFVETMCIPCMLDKRKSIKNLSMLKMELSLLWKDVASYCAKCTFPDCMGYIYVMPEEEKQLLDAGFEIVQLNGEKGPLFLDCYPRDREGRIIVNFKKPLCQYRSKCGLCSKHSDKPIVCHLYPLGLETDVSGRIFWGLHKDCLFVRNSMDNRTIDELKRKIASLIARIDLKLRYDIMQTYIKADKVSAKPDGENEYFPIIEEYI